MQVSLSFLRSYLDFCFFSNTGSVNFLSSTLNSMTLSLDFNPTKFLVTVQLKMIHNFKQNNAYENGNAIGSLMNLPPKMNVW